MLSPLIDDLRTGMWATKIGQMMFMQRSKGSIPEFHTFLKARRLHEALDGKPRQSIEDLKKSLAVQTTDF